MPVTIEQHQEELNFFATGDVNMDETNELKHTDVICPHCGHSMHLDLDCSNGDQDYIEDCPNCCNPIHIHLHLDELNKKIEVSISSDDEQIY